MRINVLRWFGPYQVWHIRVHVDLVPVILCWMIFVPLLTTRPRKHMPACCTVSVIFDFLVFHVSNFRFVVMMTKLYFWIIGDNCYKRLDTLCRCAWMSCGIKRDKQTKRRTKSLYFLPACARVVTSRNMITLSALEFCLCIFHCYCFSLLTEISEQGKQPRLHHHHHHHHLIFITYALVTAIQFQIAEQTR